MCTGVLRAQWCGVRCSCCRIAAAFCQQRKIQQALRVVIGSAQQLAARHFFERGRYPARQGNARRIQWQRVAKAGQGGAVADPSDGLWHATGELRAIPNPKELPAPGVTLTPTPISLRISGPPNSKLSLTLRVNAHPDEAGNAAVVQIEVGSEKGEAESIYGHFNQQLGRFRYLPRPNRAGLCRLEFLLPPDGVIRLAFRGWRNQHAIQISETVAIEV